MGLSGPGGPDLDYLVTGLPLSEILERLKEHGDAELVGVSFGVVKFTRDGHTVDVALPRRERSTGAGHRDFSVEASPDVPLEEDLSRRDFKMNMLARDLRSGTVLDPFGGCADIAARRLDVLREEAFVEDPLRVLRGAQFAARFKLTVTPKTAEAMRAAAGRIPTIAPERVGDELTKLLVRAGAPSIGLELLREVGALEHVLPELLEGWRVEQNEFHRYTVYYHSLYTCDAAPRELVLRLGALLHDVGKPRTKEGPHFYRHERVGEGMARAALQRLRFSSEVVERVAQLVANHMYAADDGLSDAAVRRFIRRVGPQHVEDLFALRRADVEGTGLALRDPDQNARFERRVRAELAGPRAFSVTDLAIRGDDVIAVMRELGLVGSDFAGDRRVGAALAFCLERVLEEPAQNTAAALRGIVREFFADGPPAGAAR